MDCRGRLPLLPGLRYGRRDYPVLWLEAMMAVGFKAQARLLGIYTSSLLLVALPRLRRNKTEADLVCLLS